MANRTRMLSQIMNPPRILMTIVQRKLVTAAAASIARICHQLTLMSAAIFWITA